MPEEAPQPPVRSRADRLADTLEGLGRDEDAHARSTGFDPRTLADEYVYLRIAPHEIQVWRESNELEGRS